jgi:hypothetical protein
MKLYCPICGALGADGRKRCPRYGCGWAKLIPLEDAVAVNEAVGKLLSPDEETL